MYLLFKSQKTYHKGAFENMYELHLSIQMFLGNDQTYIGRLEEVHLVQDIVKLGLDCKSFLNGRVNQALCHCKKDLRCISESLLCALKVLILLQSYVFYLCVSFALEENLPYNVFTHNHDGSIFHNE